MSNLSELLPAGAGAKSAKFVASGTLASGQTVVLKTNGQVEAVALTAEVVGTPVTFEAARIDWPGCAYDPNTNKVMIFYYKTVGQLWGVVGTVSGSTLSFGTPLLMVNSVGIYDTVGCLYDPVSQNIVYAYRDGGSGPQVIIATVSGTSFTFGSVIVVDTPGGQENGASMVYDTNANKILFAYPDAGSSQYGTGRVGTVSGQTMSFGTKTVFNSGSTNFSAMAYDSVAQKIVMMYNNGGPGMAQVATISGTGVSFGTAIEFGAAAGGLGTKASGCAYDVSSNKTVLGYSQNTGGSGIALTASISGTSLTLGTKVTFYAGAMGHPLRLVYDANAQKVLALYEDISNSNSGRLNDLSVSGSTITAGTQTTWNATNTIQIFAAYDSTAKKTIIAFSNGLTDGEAIVYSPSATNSTSFIGITDEAISSAASGSVIVQGGVGTGVSLPYPLIVGAPVIFEAAATYSTATVFDSNSNKVVISYRDVGNSSYGTSVVGTVSGTTITFGTPVVFETASVNHLRATFDSNSNKVVIVYSDVGNSSYGTAIVGTVSGTSISFGTAVVYNSSGISDSGVTFDSTNNKVVIAYQHNTNSNYGTAIVGTVSGTAISFGTDVVFETASVASVAATFDSANNKVVIAYKDEGNSSYGTAIIGTVSGTAISFGTAAVFEAASTTYITATFDSNANKVAIAYKDNGTTYGTAVVGTVSATSISFGTAVVFETASTNNSTATFDSSSNRVVISYTDAGNSSHGTSIAGTISGTSISFGTPVVFEATSTTYITATFDSVNNKTVTAYQNSATYGSAVVSNIPNLLTIGTDYFVQSDGTLSTTSSTVPAGRALTTSSILLEG